MPGFLLEWLRGIREAGKREGKRGVVIWSRPNCPRRDALVIMKWDDFVALAASGGVDANDVPVTEIGPEISLDGQET